MNQRIRELVGRAEAYAYEHEEHWHDGPDWQELFNKKFAELIVRECIAIVAPSSYRRAYPENYRGGMDCLDTLDDRVEKIKEHFGVDGD